MMGTKSYFFIADIKLILSGCLTYIKKHFYRGNRFATTLIVIPSYNMFNYETLENYVKSKLKDHVSGNPYLYIEGLKDMFSVKSCSMLLRVIQCVIYIFYI